MDRPLTHVDVTNIKAADRPDKLYKYVVEGRGSFPIDMLRYDQCWPVDSHSVPHPTQEHRTVEMRSYRPPTVDRWNSFGWRVI
jgi:hypothetical protein